MPIASAYSQKPAGVVMPRLRTILQVATVLSTAILTAGWAGSVLGDYSFSFTLPLGRLRYTIVGASGSLGAEFDKIEYSWRKNGFDCHRRTEPLQWRTIAGRFAVYRLWKSTFGNNWHARIPFCVILTAILPIALGSFHSFRFRLWHYFAYTTLVAAELAYYIAQGPWYWGP